MSGVLKAKVGGVWVPVGSPGPTGPQGAPGIPGASATASVKARAFNADFGPGTGLPAARNVLQLNNIFLTDGFSLIGTQGIKVTSAGRFLVTACVTIVGANSSNWIIFGVEHRRFSDSAVYRSYEVVASNVSNGYRMMQIAFTLDVVDNDFFYVIVNPDIGTPTVDGRSWVSISEVAW